MARLQVVHQIDRQQAEGGHRQAHLARPPHHAAFSAGTVESIEIVAHIRQPGPADSSQYFHSNMFFSNRSLRK